MENSKLRKVYDTIVKEGYDVPDYATFESDMRDDNKLTQVRDRLVEDGYELPDFGQFKIDMFGAPQEKAWWQTEVNAPKAESPYPVNPVEFQGQVDQEENVIAERLPQANAAMSQRMQQGQTMQGAFNRFLAGDTYAKEGTPEYARAQRTQMRNKFVTLPEEQRKEWLGGDVEKVGKDFEAANGRKAKDELELFEWRTGGYSVAPEVAAEDTDPNDIAKYNGYSANEINAGWGDEKARALLVKDRLTPQLEEAAARNVELLGKKEEELQKAYYDEYRRNAGTPGYFPDDTSWGGKGRAMDKDWRMLKAAENINRETEQLVDAAVNDRNGWTAFGRTLANIDTWFPVMSGLELSALMELKNVDPEKASPAQKALMEALALRASAEASYEGDISNWYKVGEGVANMIPLWFEMAFNPLSGVGKAAAKKVAKGVMKSQTNKALAESGKAAMKQWQRRVLAKGAGFLGSLAGGAGMAVTTSLPKVAVGAGLNSMGQAQYDINAGGIEFDSMMPGGSYWSEFGKEFARTAIEHGTEQMGAEWLGKAIGKPLKWVGKGVSKIPGVGKGVTRTAQFLEDLGGEKYELLKNLAKDVKYDGPLEEFGEEFMSALLTRPIDDDSLKKFFEKDNLLVTLGTVVTPFGVGATMAGGYNALKGNYKAGAKEWKKREAANYRAQNAFGENQVEWRNIMYNLNNPDTFVEEMQRIYNSPDYTNEQKKNALEYAVHTLRYMAATGSQIDLDENTQMLNGMLRESYGWAYENTAPEAVNGNMVVAADKALRDAESAAKTALGLQSDTSIEDFIGGRSVDEVAMGDDAVAEALRAYYAEKALFEGMQDKMQDTRENEYLEADKSVDAVAHEDGNVYRTTLPETGETIFITSGKVVLDNEGYIDVNQSEKLVALMPNSKKEAIQAGNIRNKVVVENAQEQKNVKRAEIDARYKQQLNTFTYTDKADGTEHTVQLVSRGEQMARVILDGVEQDVPNNVFDEIVAEATGENGEALQTENQIEVAPVQTELPKEKQAVASIPTEKRGKEERAAYHMVPIERTMEDLHDGTLEPDEIVGLIDARIKEAENDVKNVEKKKPIIGADKDAYVAAKQQWQADMEAAKAKLDYYNNLKAVNAEATRSEMREAVEGVAPQTLIEQTADEFVANLLGGWIKITPESFQKETGLKAEQKQMVGVIAGKEKGGVTVEQAAEIILENYGDELRGLGFNGDMQDMRDMIINILSNGNPRSYARKGAEMRAQQSVEQQRAELENVANGLKFNSIEEQIEYEEAVVPRIIQDYTGFDEQEYFNNLAENYKYDTTGEGEGTRGGSELLQGKQAADNAGVGDITEPGQGGKVQGDVYSGGENAASQGNQQQVSSPEIPNNQIPGLKGYTTDEVLNLTKGHITDILGGDISIVDMRVIGSRSNGTNSENSDLDVLVEFDGDISEDAFFNAVNGEDALYIDGVRVDINPITKDKSGTIEQWMNRNAGYSKTEGGNASGQSGVQQNESGKQSLAEKVVATAKKKQQARLADHAKGIAEKLGVEVTVHNDESTVTNKDAMQAITEGGEVKGWYNPNTGEIALFMPNMESMRDVESTILHEAVSHYGIKHFLGKEDFDKFLDGVWDMMPAGARAFYLDYVGADMKNPSLAKMRQAADEYVAHIAEKMDLNELERSVWQRFIDYVMDVLRKAGFKNLKQRDVEAVIRASYANLRTNGNGKTENGKGSQVTGQGETMASKKSGNKKSHKNQPASSDKKSAGLNHSSTVDTSAKTVTKIKINTETAKLELGKLAEAYKGSKKVRGFLGDLAMALGDKQPKESYYFEFKNKNGEVYTLRIANHNVNGDNARADEQEISIVVKSRRSKNTFTFKEGLKEFVYFKEDIKNGDGNTLELIAKDISNLLDTGVYVDSSGIAAVNPKENSSKGGTMFRKANKNQEVFVSNAQRAVEGIKQEKATPEQWIAMLKKNGGLKAGEEAWLGLEEWLNEKQGAVTKQEILDFIGENKIQIEEVEYESNPQSFEDLKEEYEAMLRDEGYDAAHDAMVDRFGDDFDIAFEDLGGELAIANEEAAATLLGSGNIINSTRLDYTTEGLENKREIALSVPTIEPYNQNDDIHFGDAGDGRAVAWVRFGETTADTDETIAAKKAVNDYLAEMREKYNTLEGEETDAMTAEEIKHLQELTAKEIESGEKKARVLVIDEIQSKRHQDGREKGYKSQADKTPATMEELTFGEYNGLTTVSLRGERFFFKSSTSKDEILDIINKRIADGQLGAANSLVPDAPFEKNWHELAMKRMLRLAAEEGFDKVAWTTGEQQAERYNLGKAFNDIEREDNPNIDGRRFVLNGANVETFQVDENGNIIDSTIEEAKNKPLVEVVGKDMAVKMMSLENGDMLEDEDLRIGGEGMKGFYDKMLPSFVSKYTKKWGAKVGEVTMPNLGENNTMHSVDVTPEMKESVMEGQTMFSKRMPDKDAPIKEHTRTWAERCQEENPKLWNEVVEALKVLPEWGDAVDADARAMELLESLCERENYSRVEKEMKTGIERANGVFEMAERISSWAKVKAALKSFWNWVQRNVFHTEPMDWQDFVDDVVGRYYGVSKVQRLQERLIKKYGLDRTVTEIISGPYAMDAEVWSNLPESFYDKYDAYKRLAGEVEARNVQERMGMTPKERRNKLAEETEDVRREDQTFIYDALVSAMMGSRVDARMAEVASHFDGKELSAEQRAVADVFGGKADNLTISVKTQDGNTRNVEMRQGNDLAGAKHSLYAHYGTTKGVINADDLLLIPDVIANGERTENGKKAVYKLDVNGTKYTVVTYVKQNKEEFHNFYSNKKGQPSQSVNASIGDTHSARITEELASADKGSASSAEMQEGETLFRKAEQDSEEARRKIESLDNEVLATIEELAQELYSNVGIITDIESIPDEKKRTDAKRGMKGWYDPATGVVAVVLPNIADKQDAVETMLHEIVGHKGLRGLLGEKYNEFLNEVFVNAPKEMRADIMKIVMAQKADGSRTPLRTAVEEYLAGIAEGGFANNPTLWTKIMTALKQLLRSMGVKVDVSENELAYMLWRSHQLLKGGYDLESRIIDSVMKQRMEVGEYRRRRTAFHGPMRSQGRNLAKEIELFGLRDEYEKMILSTGFQSREAFQDSMFALKKFQEMLEKATGKKLPDYFNAYYMENALSSANQAQAEAYGRLFYKKIVDEVNALKEMFEQEDIFDYLIIKHGIERNREMAVRSVLSSEENGLDRKMYNKYVAKKKEILKNAKENELSWEETQRELDELAVRFGADLSKDYSGLSAIFSKVKGKGVLEAAYNHVLNMDKKGDFANLHQAIKAATDETLEKRYSTGMLSKKTKEEILDMYEYYVPLRGFEEQTSEDVYHYMTTKSSPISSVKAARGRTSKSDNAIAWIANAAEEAIVRGNRNMMKLAFFNAVAANPNDLVSIEGNTYLELKNGQWTVAFPDIPVNATPEQVREIWDDFVKEKELQAKKNPDMVKKVSDNADIPYTVVQQGELQEHQIFVRRNGKLYTMTVNGNPRLAQAINGVTNPNTTDSKLMNKIADTVQSINSGLSRVYTTANPDFVLSNWLRDMIYSNSMVWVKESPAYAWKFNLNCGLNARGVFKLLTKYENGTLDMKNDVERMFHEFITYGGETGYTQLKDYEASKKELQKMLKKGIPGGATAAAVQHFAAQINRAVENAARFAAFRTSREMGRSITRSVHDAKEISVNFNKKGAGARFFGAKGQTKTGSAIAAISGIGRGGFVFWNAGVQGMYNFFSALYDHKAKGAAMIFAPLLLGYLAASMGDDDDDYQNLSPYIRRSNLCFKLTDGTFLTIPLPIEYRAIYGTAEYLANVWNGKEEFEGFELAGQLSQLMPLDMLEGGGGFKAFVPSLLKPIYEVATNKDWTGRPIAKQTDFNKLDPEYKRVYGDVSAATMAFSKMMNELGGGNPNRRADATIEIGDEKYEPFEWNPAYIENTLRGYLGGVFSFPEKVAKTAGMIAGKREFDWRHVPLANRILKTSTEKAEEYKVNSNFFDNLGRFEKDWHEMRGWKKDAFDFKGTEDERERALTRYGELLDKNGKLRELYIIESRIDKSNSLYKEFGEEAFKQQMLKYRMEFNKKFNEIYE